MDKASRVNCACVFKCLQQTNLVPRVFVLLDQRSENERLWEHPFWNDKGNNRILPIIFHCAVCACIYCAGLKWLLPKSLVFRRWSRGTKTLAANHNLFGCIRTVTKVITASRDLCLDKQNLIKISTLSLQIGLAGLFLCFSEDKINFHWCTRQTKIHEKSFGLKESAGSFFFRYV